MTEEQRDLLCRGLTRLGVPYTPEAVEQAGALLPAAAGEKPGDDLTAITDPGRM